MFYPFSTSDWQNYLKAELYHSLEKYNIHHDIDSYLIKIDHNNIGRAFAISTFKILSDFYNFLPQVRYCLDIIDECKNIDYTETNYNESVKNKYSILIGSMNNLIISLFRTLRKGWDDVDGKKVDNIESYLIYNIYDKVQSNLGEILKKYNNLDELNLSKHIDNLIREGFEYVIAKRFLINNATLIERNERECGYRILLYKQRRYSNDDRAGYWLKYINKDDLIFRKLKRESEEFLEDINKGRLMAGLLMLILCKYHIILHHHAGNEFRYLSQHKDMALKGNEIVVRAQKIFTFTRLIAKYFPDIFAINKDKSHAIAKVIEIISYLRRGYSFEVLGYPEKAFNDYSSAEKQANELNERFPKSGEDFVKLYQKLTVPYIYSLKGELYRRNFAFYNAHQYFCNSVFRFDEIYQSKNRKENKLIKNILDSSLKIGRIKMFKGKTFFELGEFRKALKWHIKSLKQLLKALNISIEEQIFNSVIDYLEKKRLDPKANKKNLFDELISLTECIIKVVDINNDVIKNYAILLSDLFTRISLIIYIFNLPNYNDNGYDIAKGEYENEISLLKREVIKDNLCRDCLARKWLDLALILNPKSGIANFNQRIYDSESPCPLSTLNRKEVVNQTSDSVISTVDVLTPGEPRNIIYSLIAKATLDSLTYNKPTTEEGEIAKKLFLKLLLYVDDFSTRNAELYKYLMKPRKFGESCDKNRPKKPESLHFLFLQRWSSINPALPRPSAFKMKGGGYFVIFKGQGIAIDPGINFVENLYSEGFSIADINYIITTHDHIDHIAELDTIMALHYRRYNKLEGHKQLLTLILNPSVSARYGFLVNQDPELFRKIELTPDGKRRDIFDGFAIEAISVKHLDICSPKYSNTIGLVLCFALNDGVSEYKIGVTGDTSYDSEIINKFHDVDILVAHINSTTFREMKRMCEIGLDDNLRKVLHQLETAFCENSSCEDNLKNNPIISMQSLIKQLKYSLGYNVTNSFSIICDKQEAAKDELDGQHLFLHGVLKTYKQFKNSGELLKNNDKRLFLIAETSEEMGSYRHKVAMLINKTKLGKDGPKCLTGDIGMTIRVKPADENNDRKIEIRCSRCNLNNDYAEDDKFHSIEHIKEVCLKWEEEGLVYFCRRHDPESVNREFEKYGFTERIEKYQPLKNVEIRVS